MPRTREAAQSTTFIACLEGCVKLLNLCVALIGLSMMGLSAYFIVQLSGAQQQLVLTHGMLGSTAKVFSASWFIICFGCAGAYVFLTAVTALVGTSSRSGVCLNLNVIMVLVGLAGQLVLALVFFFDSSWQKRLPPDPAYDQVKAFIQKQIVICKWFALGALIVQLVSLLLTLILQSAYTYIEEQQEDLEEARWRTQPLLHRDRSTPPPLPQGGALRSDPWSTRMREQYGLDTSRYSYDPSGRVATGRPVLPAVAAASNSSRCTIM